MIFSSCASCQQGVPRSLAIPAAANVPSAGVHLEILNKEGRWTPEIVTGGAHHGSLQLSLRVP